MVKADSLVCLFLFLLLNRVNGFSPSCEKLIPGAYGITILKNDRIFYLR